MSAIVNARLFSIVNTFISTEVTRYYLRGVHIERHQTKGVYLVATDGHRLMCVYDENGETSLDPITVQLDKNALAMCKADKREPNDRKLHIEGDGEVAIMAYDDVKLSSFRNCIIDGTFPDWRHVTPRTFSGETTAGWNADYIGDFGKASRALTGNKTGSIKITPNEGGPALVRFPVDHAFGVLMPVRIDDANTLPWFFLEPAKPAQIAIDETTVFDKAAAE